MTIIGELLLIPLVRGLRRRGRARKPIKSMLQRTGFIAGLAGGVTQRIFEVSMTDTVLLPSFTT